MSMKNKKRSRADGAMTPEELNKAIEEYKARRAQRAGAAAPAASEDGDDVPPSQNQDPIAKSQPAVADGDDTGSTVIAASGQDGDDLENQVQVVKTNRDRRDAEGDPKDMNGAMGVIARQDSDIDLLLGIIETLLAKRDFDGSNKCDGDDDMSLIAKNAPSNGDEGGAEPDAANKGGGSASPVNPNKPSAVSGGNKDEEDPYGGEEDNADSDDDTIPTTAKPDVGKSVLNVDSVDTIVRQRIQLGVVGRALNIDGLEYMPISQAKKAVIKAVRPGLRLDGKSPAYINAAFDCAVDEVRSRSHKGVDYQKRQMFNRDSRSFVADKDSAMAARQRMIDRQMKKEDK